MSDLNQINSVELKRKLIMTIEKYPSTWKALTQTHEDWSNIAKEMDYAYTLNQMKTTWSNLKNLYFRKIFIRTIERNFEAPAWPFFHDMSYLYENTKEKIQRKLGGISPPLFKLSSDPKNTERTPCPCCIYVEADHSLEDANKETELKNIPVSEISSENSDIDSETVSLSSFIEDNEPSANSLEPQKNGVVHSLDDSPNEDVANDNFTAVYEIMDEADEDCLDELPSQVSTNEKTPEVIGLVDEAVNPLEQSPDQDLTKDKSPDEVIDLMDDDDEETNNPPRQLLPAGIYSIGINNSSENMTNPLPQLYLIPLNNPVGGQLTPQSLIFNNGSLLVDPERRLNEPTNGSLPIEPETRLNEPTQSPKPVETNTNGFSVASDSSNGSQYSNEQQMALLTLSHLNRRAIEREKLLEAIKANPIIYDPSMPKKGIEYINAWKEISKEVNVASINNLKNRWKSLKTRFLKELVYERYSDGQTKTPWESLKQLEFLRPHLQADIDEIHRTRMKMQDTIRKKAEELSNATRVANSSPEPKTPEKETGTNQTPSTVKYFEESMIAQFNENAGDNCAVAFVNANQNIQIASVESMTPEKTNCQSPEEMEQPFVLEPSALPICESQPIKISNVQAVPSLDLTNDDDDDEKEKTSCENDEVAPPPAKRLRRSTGFVINRTNVLVSGIPKSPAPETLPSPSVPKSLPLPPAPSLTLDLTADEATTDPPTTAVESNELRHQNPPKVYPPLDLTLDDEEDVLPAPVPSPEPESVAKRVSTSNFQQAFLDACLNSDKEDLPVLDLTTEDEVKETHKNGSKDLRTETNGHKSANENGKNDDSVICLDDDDDNSVTSYEEVLVYIQEEDETNEK